MKRVSLEQLVSTVKDTSYLEQYGYMKNLLEKGEIKPIKASGFNGKSPALYKEYWLLEAEKDFEGLKEELLYHIVPQISVDYYVSHLSVYEEDRKWVLLLNDYLRERKENLQDLVSVNERSFEIWQQEKFLTKGQGKKILKRCGLGLEFLNVYETTEPLAYYSHTRQTPQNLLMIENKDTFYSIRKCLLDGKDTILGIKIGTLIYGSGKGIFKAFQDFDLCVEPYMKDAENKIYYFGDLDYEGIGIYESLAEVFQDKWEIVPFFAGYQAMLKKAGKIRKLPDMKEQQNKNISGRFFAFFPKEEKQIRGFLEEGKYIPQEILNAMDW